MALINALGAVLLLLGSFLVIRAVWIADSRDQADAADSHRRPDQPSYPRAA